MKAKVVLVTSEDCPACKNFKSLIWPRLGMYLRKDTRFNLVEIHVMKNFNEIKRGHTDLLRFVRWFPTIMVFTGESWASTSLEGKVFNGEFQSDKMTHYKDIVAKANQIIPMQHQQIYNWIDSEITKLGKSRPAVIIEDDITVTTTTTTTKPRNRYRSMYDDKTEFVENEFEYD